MADSAQISWLEQGRFYSLTSSTDVDDELLFLRIGASDPHFNLRPDPAWMLRRKNAQDTVFASVIEAHGSYDPVRESSTNPRSKLAAVRVLHDSSAYTAVSLEGVAGQVAVFLIANQASTTPVAHELILNDVRYQWSGPYAYRTLAAGALGR